jgi:hypothetical protein
MFTKIILLLTISTLVLSVDVNGCKSKLCAQCSLDAAGNKSCSSCYGAIKKAMATPTTAFECIEGALTNCITFYDDADPARSGCRICIGNQRPIQRTKVDKKDVYNCENPPTPVVKCTEQTETGCTRCEQGYVLVSESSCVAVVNKINNCYTYKGAGVAQVCVQCEKGHSLMTGGTMCSSSTGGCFSSLPSDANMCVDCDVHNGYWATDFKGGVTVCSLHMALTILKTVTLVVLGVLGLAVY